MSNGVDAAVFETKCKYCAVLLYYLQAVAKVAIIHTRPTVFPLFSSRFKGSIGREVFV